MEFGMLKWLAPVLALGAMAVALSGCTASGALSLLISSRNYTLHEGLAYGGTPRQTLDVYVPKTPAPPGGRTVVVFFYGGSWSGGERGTYKFVGEALASRGYVAVIPDYRVYPEAVYPVFVEDAAGAVKWAADHAADFGGDPQRIVLMGHSAGAHLAALVTLDPQFLRGVGLPRETVKGFVGLAGPYSFKPLEYDSTRKVFGHLKDPEIVRPVLYAANPAPPILLLHGSDDTTVGPYNAEDLTAALQKGGNPVTHKVYKGVAHVGIILAMAAPFRSRAPTVDDAVAFIDGLFQSKSEP